MSESEVRTAGPARRRLLAPHALAILGDLARAALPISTTATRSPASGAPEKPSTSTGMAGGASVEGHALVVDQRANAAPVRTGDDEIADPQRAALHEHGGDRAAAAVEPRLDDRAFGAARGIGDEVEQLGLERDRLEQLVEVDLLGRRDLDGQRVAAERLDLHVVLQQFLHHPLRIGVGLVDLVDGDDDRRAWPPWRGGSPRSSAA